LKYLVAVSGGVDSVVLLDMLAGEGKYELVVAHFDHGIRDDSAADARFVEALAHKYGIDFVMRREELGKNASEELARMRRYEFLQSEAKKHGATIATAHHADDVIETIAINISRGTGWRGVAVLDNPAIYRPLLSLTKEKIRTYARSKRLEWVEDSTNAETKYLRNRIRRLIAEKLNDEQRQEVLATWKRQVGLKAQINVEVLPFIHQDGEYSRYFFTQVEDNAASELLRAFILVKGGEGPTRPQASRALIAIKTARPHSVYEVGARTKLRFTTRTFIVETP
jgi:tRNA(Ile)-lysidine synthetase-like protein